MGAGLYYVFLYLILVVLTILWVYVILSRLMGRRDICSDKNYDKMSFGEDYVREQEGGSTKKKKKKKKKKKGTTAVAYFSYGTLRQRIKFPPSKANVNR